MGIELIKMLQISVFTESFFKNKLTWIVESLWLISRVLKNFILTILPVVLLLLWKGKFSEVLFNYFDLYHPLVHNHFN